jgi:two-component system nitrogen regulation response regulator NtrX
VRESFRVLVVDDDPCIRDYLEALGAHRGWRIFVAPGGEEALRSFDAVRPDVVTLDVTLPGMDGLETLRRLKESWPQVPVIMVSGHERRSTVAAALELGASDFLHKPFAVEDLEAAFRSVLGWRGATDGEGSPQE